VLSVLDLDGSTWSASHSGRFTAGKKTGYTLYTFAVHSVGLYKRVFQNKKKLFDNTHTQMHVTLVVF
jgi:hypothetical protein